jgi:hypothetical protein
MTRPTTIVRSSSSKSHITPSRGSDPTFPPSGKADAAYVGDPHCPPWHCNPPHSVRSATLLGWQLPLPSQVSASVQASSTPLPQAAPVKALPCWQALPKQESLVQAL